jgi:hypothetical protein
MAILEEQIDGFTAATSQRRTGATGAFRLSKRESRTAWCAAREKQKTIHRRISPSKARESHDLVRSQGKTKNNPPAHFAFQFPRVARRCKRA